MKKRIILLVLVFTFGIFVDKLLFTNKSSEFNNIKVKKSVSNISMMLETGASTGVYELTTRSNWPTDGYIFNKELSKCENGSSLSWDDDAKTVVMSGNVSDKCYIYFDVFSLASINNLSEEVSYNSITVTAQVTEGTKPISKYYYSSDGGSTYTESTSSTYTFTNLSKGTNYSIKTYVIDTNNNASSIYSKVIRTNITLVDYVKNSYSSQGENGLYYHDSSLTDGANDNSYRYAGADPNNYVCFGSDAETCPSDNLFRIIGVIDNKIKLVKNTYAGSNLLGTDGTYVSDNAYMFYQYYNSCPSDTTAYLYSNSNSITRLANKNTIGAPSALSGCNEWKYSDLNTINLNTNYLNTFNDNYKNKIADTIWTTENNNTQKIGLISYNDYKYICPRGYWDLSDSYSYKDFNWFYDDFNYGNPLIDGYATITKTGDIWGYDVAIYVVKPTDYSHVDTYQDFDNGGVIAFGAVQAHYYIKPSFFLNANVNYQSGTGEINSPIRLS